MQRWRLKSHNSIRMEMSLQVTFSYSSMKLGLGFGFWCVCKLQGYHISVKRQHFWAFHFQHKTSTTSTISISEEKSLSTFLFVKCNSIIHYHWLMMNFQNIMPFAICVLAGLPVFYLPCPTYPHMYAQEITKLFENSIFVRKERRQIFYVFPIKFQEQFRKIFLSSRKNWNVH